MEGGGGGAAFATAGVAAGAVDFAVDAGAAAAGATSAGGVRAGTSGMMTRTITDSFGGGSGCIGGSAPGGLAARLTASASGITFRCTTGAAGGSTAFGSGGAVEVVAGTPGVAARTACADCTCAAVTAPVGASPVESAVAKGVVGGPGGFFRILTRVFLAAFPTVAATMPCIATVPWGPAEAG